jgi:hypothetical protein
VYENRSFLQFHNEYGSTRKEYDTFKKFLQGDEDEKKHDLHTIIIVKR